MMTILMLLSYPLFSHIFVVLGHPEWVTIYLIIICAFFFTKELITQNYIAAIFIMPLLLAGVVLAIQGRMDVLIYLPPIFISLGLFILFGGSLRKDRIPLVTRYAQLIDGELSQEIMLYTKRITQIWTVFFLIMLIESIVLGIYFSIEIWSLFTNLLNYLLIIIIFVAEYIYRSRIYPELPKRKFTDFLQKIIRIRPSQLRI